MQQLVAGLLKFSCRGADRGGIGHIELDADLRYQPSCRPLVGPEARLGGLRQRPNAERLAAGELLAVVVAVTLAVQRKTQRVDIQAAAAGGIGSDYGPRSRGTRCSRHVLLHELDHARPATGV
jgi:hypothetical protein